MKRIILLCAFIMAAASGFSQPNFVYYYTPTLGASPNVYPVVARAYDGSIMGISFSASGSSNSFLLFKIDINGNMLWQKDIFMGPVSNYIPHGVCMLTDSTLAIIVKADSSNNVFVIIKCDLSGNIIWDKVYSSPSVLSNYCQIEPGSNGGIMVSGSSYIAFINSSGGVVNAFSYSGVFSWQAAPAGPGVFTVWGTHPSGLPQDFFLLDIDTAGTISNYFTYSIPGGTPASGMYNPFYLISKSPSGGTYCIFGLQSIPDTKFIVFYFNALNQPVWANKISLSAGLIPHIITACKDNGCIISGATTYFPLVMKFDSTGTLDWMRTPGNFSNSLWTNFDIFDMVPDTGSGWYYTLAKPKIHLVHTDSAFNGFCHYENTQPIITSMPVTTNPDIAISFPITFTDSIFYPASTLHNFYQYNACTGILIDSSTAVNKVTALDDYVLIHPNPALEKVTIKFPGNMRNVSIVVFNLVGKKLIENYFYDQEENTINLDNIPPGMYIISINDGKKNYYKKLIIKQK